MPEKDTPQGDLSLSVKGSEWLKTDVRAYGRYDSNEGNMARTNSCASASAGARLPSSLRSTGTMTRTNEPFVRLVTNASRINSARLQYSLATTRPRP